MSTNNFKSACALIAATSLLATYTTSASAIGVNQAQTVATPVLAAQDDGGRSRSGGIVGNIFGCQANGSKQEIGAVVGGVAGGLLGNRIAGRGSRTLGTLIGGVVGGAAGSVLGCKLQNNDRVKAERALERAVATNQNQSWESDETGASGRVDVGTETRGVALSELKFARGVEPAPGYARVAENYTAPSSVNIRSAPGTNAAVLGKLRAGQSVWVPARVNGSPWMLISQDGVARGYVSSALLKRAPSVAAASNCKTVTQTISTQDAPAESEKFNACRGQDGQWTMTRV